MLYPFPFWVRRRKAEREGKGAEGVAWWGRVWRQQEGREKRGDSDLATGAPAASLTREARVSLTALEGNRTLTLMPHASDGPWVAGKCGALYGLVWCV